MKTVLLTGFEAFGGEKLNPSWEAVKTLDRTTVGAHRVVALRLPTVFGKSAELVENAIDELRPAVVISVGESGGSFGIRVERFGLNLDDARIPDNEGNRPADTPAAEGGAIGYFATLPTKKILEALLLEGIPAALSYSAGTYVCNHVFYRVLHHIAIRDLNTKAGFLHVPYLPSQAAAKRNMPSMTAELIAKAVRISIESSL